MMSSRTSLARARMHTIARAGLHYVIRFNVYMSVPFKHVEIRQHVSREQMRRFLQGAPQLRPFLLPHLTPTGRQLGGGSYGVVEELEMDGLVCAGKKLYDTLIEAENLGALRMVDRYYGECSLLSELRHPHVVQFLGICLLPDSHLPILVMERLQGSLDELLESMPDIALPIKLSGCGPGSGVPAQPQSSRHPQGPDCPQHLPQLRHDCKNR